MAVEKKSTKKKESEISELSLTIKEMFSHTQKHIEETDKKISDHIKIYSENGVESKRVADNLENLIDVVSEIGDKVDAMYSTMYQDYQGEQYRQKKNGETLKTIGLWGATIATLTGIAAFIVKIGSK